MLNFSALLRVLFFGVLVLADLCSVYASAYSVESPSFEVEANSEVNLVDALEEGNSKSVLPLAATKTLSFEVTFADKDNHSTAVQLSKNTTFSIDYGSSSGSPNTFTNSKIRGVGVGIIPVDGEGRGFNATTWGFQITADQNFSLDALKLGRRADINPSKPDSFTIAGYKNGTEVITEEVEWTLSKANDIETFTRGQGTWANNSKWQNIDKVVVRWGNPQNSGFQEIAAVSAGVSDPVVPVAPTPKTVDFKVFSPSVANYSTTVQLKKSTKFTLDYGGSAGSPNTFTDSNVFGFGTNLAPAVGSIFNFNTWGLQITADQSFSLDNLELGRYSSPVAGKSEKFTIAGYKNGTEVIKQEIQWVGTASFTAETFTRGEGSWTDDPKWQNIDKVVVRWGDPQQVGFAPVLSYSAGVSDPMASTTAPSVSTGSASAISSTSATLAGQVTGDGGDAVTARGFLYSSTDNSPTLGETGVIQLADGNGLGSFNEQITALTESTTYYFRAYATNSVGTSYGETKSFATQAAPVKKPLTLASQNLVITKVYDGSNSASITGVVLSGVETGDVVTVQASASYDNSRAGTGKTITVTYTLEGADAAKYKAPESFTLTTAEITPKVLTISGLSGQDRDYDGTTEAQVTGIAALAGVLGADDVVLGGSPNFVFENKNAGPSVKIVVSGYTITGEDASNYSLEQPAGLKANIGRIPLTLIGLSAEDKSYDGTQAAKLVGTAAFEGLISGDEVVISSTPEYSFSQVGVGTDISVTTFDCVGFEIGGADANNYYLDNNYPEFRASILPKGLTITADEGQSKIYGEEDPKYTFKATGFENGDDEEILTGYLERAEGESVGSYAINQGTLAAGDNYTIDFTGADFAIIKKTLTINVDEGQSKIYGEEDPKLTFKATGFENGDDEEILTGYLERAEGESVGSYAINQGTLAAGDNYTIDFNGANFAITKKTLTITVDEGQSKIFGEEDPKYTFQASGFENGDDEEILTGNLERAEGENVGNYAINQGTLAAGDNYTIDFTGADFAITKKTLTITVNEGQSKIYGEEDPKLTFKASGFENEDDEEILTGYLERAEGETVGNYAINQGTLAAGDNYTIDFTGADFAITKKTLTITVDEGQSKIYGEEDPKYTFQASGFENGDDEEILTGYLERAEGETVGNYAINQGTLAAGDNYTIDFTGADFAITKKTLTITANEGQSKIYGEEDPKYTFKATGFENGDDEEVLTGNLERAEGENVGSYAINQGTLAAGDNYTIDFNGADFAITKKTLTITANEGQSKIFGEEDPKYTFQATGFENGDDEEILTGYLERAEGESVGSYAINQGTLAAGDNYTIDFTGADFAITKKTLTITVNEGQSKIYGEEDPKYTFKATGFENGDDEEVLTGNLERAEGENVGSYAINQGTLAAGDNYTIDFTGADFAITKKTLTITVDEGQSKIFGEEDPKYTFKASGFENEDDEEILTGNLERAEGENVGSYAINQGTLAAGDNYTIDFTGADFVITKKTLTINVDEGQSKIYGEEDPKLTFKATGFENGDDEEILTGYLERAEGETVGNYAINQGTLAAGDNYTIDFTGADFAITKKTLTITVNEGQSKIYGEEDPKYTFKATGFENGDDEEILTGYLERAEGETVGSYSINRGTLAAGDNYTIDFTGADFAIIKKTLTITVDEGQSKIYGEEDPKYTFQATGFENGDDEEVLTGILERAEGENVGNYTINQGTLAAGDNYTIDFTGADFAITKKTLTITVDEGQSKIYGEEDPKYTFQASGFENGDDEEILTGILERAEGENVGNYTINQGTLAAGDNYTIDFTGADFAITKKTLTITVDEGQSKIYGEEDPKYTFKASGFENGDDEEVLTGILERAEGENVGNYTINQGTLAAGDNYTIDFSGADFAITKKTLTITVDEGQGKIYGEEDPKLTFEATGFANGEDEEILTGTLERVEGESVGSYAINQGTLAAGDNYTIDFTGADFAITKKTLTITAEDKSKIYGEANPALTFTYSGLVNGDSKVTTEPGIATTATASSSVGEYPITLSGGSDANYAINLVNGTLTIGKKSLTITAEDKSKIYGEANPALTFTYSGLVNGDTKVSTEPSVATTATVSSSVGYYPITLTGGSDANYAINLVNGTLTIGKKDLTITAEDKSKIYGEANPALTFTYSGLVNGDTQVTTEPSIATTATVSSSVGYYPITLTGGSDANYAINLVNGTLTIGKKSLTITAEDKSKIFGTADPELTYVIAGLTAGDGESLITGALARVAGEEVGSYDISQGDLDAGLNYAIKFTAASLEIIPASLAVVNNPELISTTWSVVPELPATVSILTADGQVWNIAVQWQTSTLNVYARGIYFISGDLQLPAGILNESETQALQQVEVQAKDLPQDVLLNRSSFDPSPTVFFQEVGSFSVVDPVDDMHAITLVEGAVDNRFFEIIDGILFWSSSDQASGKVEFTIRVRVMDRDGNVLDKDFVITRTRDNLDSLTVYNSFTPDGDGVNDTWGLPDLRYFTGVKLMVIDRSGERIFYTEDPDIRWDGTYQGKELPTGAYTWVIQVIETGELRSGVLNLIR
ncbi:MBG domain-containing protein [Algoriphagus namhaensis]